MIVLGLTGSIAMGKSTTAQMLRNMGIPVHDSDVAVHAALGPNGVAVDAVRALFPAAYDSKTNSINRTILGQIVFGDTAQKSALEGILHPIVREMQQQFLLGCKAKGSEIVVLDIPLLYETGAETRVDKVIVASCPSFLQRLRAMNRPQMTEAKFQAILASQMPDAEKRKRADFIVQTGLGRPHAQAALNKIIASLQTRQSHDPHSNDLPPRP